MVKDVAPEPPSQLDLPLVRHPQVVAIPVQPQLERRRERREPLRSSVDEQPVFPTPTPFTLCQTLDPRGEVEEKKKKKKNAQVPSDKQTSHDNVDVVPLERLGNVHRLSRGPVQLARHRPPLVLVPEQRQRSSQRCDRHLPTHPTQSKFQNLPRREVGSAEVERRGDEP